MMDIREKITAANEQAVSRIINSDPVWADILPAGEVIDVDAYTGGFNLQIAFSTAHLAATSAAAELASK